MEIQDAKQARPHCELIAELLDSRQPKTEREHAAVREIERLRVELAACQQDAERYRWLRDNGDGFEITVREVNEDGGEEWIAGYSGPELDIAIDTARKGEGE